jgi:hypothetical protein
MMEENTNLIDELIEKTVEYGKSSLELAKLKAIDKTSDSISSVFAHSVVIVILVAFMLFLSLGVAFWLGKIMGEIHLGFFAVAIFYCITAILIYLFMLKWIKKHIGNTIIKQILK